MRIAISNIAWDVSEDKQIADLLGRYGVDAIDIAPGKYFPEPERVTDTDISRVRRWWGDRGIEITGMQALLFGTKGLNLFDNSEVQRAMLQRIGAVCRIAAGLGATRLVFGSPRNRDRSGLAEEQVGTVAGDFFRRLGDIADYHEVVICLEPNPACYGCNFLTGSLETASFVERLSHPAVKMQLDTGAITLNGEDPQAVIETCAHLVGHIHASEPNLVPLGDGGTNHAEIGKFVAKTLPNHVVAIEMLATSEEKRITKIEQALEIVRRDYLAA